MDIHNNVNLKNPEQDEQPVAEVLDVVRSLTSIVNQTTTRSTTTPISHVYTNDLRSQIRNIYKKYKRQLTESIWISTMGDSTRTQTNTQVQTQTVTIVRRN